MAEVRWHPRAWQTLESLSELQARRITQTVAMLRSFSQIGATLQYPGWTNMRRVLAGGWAVVYAYEAHLDLVTVYVLRPPRVGWPGELR